MKQFNRHLIALFSFVLLSGISLAAQTVEKYPRNDYSLCKVHEIKELAPGKISFNKPNTDKKLIFCEDLLTGIDSKLTLFSYTIIETHASIHFKETVDSIPIIIYDFIDDCANKFLTKQFHDIEFMDVLAAGVYNQAYVCRVFTDKNGFSAVCFKGLLIDESIISVESSKELIRFVRENLSQRILRSKGLMKNTSAKHKYYNHSGDTLRILKISGIGTKKLHFTLLERIDKTAFKVMVNGYADIVSDSEIDENEEGEAVFSQAYGYDQNTPYYYLRTDEEKNSFIRMQIFDLSINSRTPLYHYYFKRCK